MEWFSRFADNLYNDYDIPLRCGYIDADQVLNEYEYRMEVDLGYRNEAFNSVAHIQVLVYHRGRLWVLSNDDRFYMLEPRAYLRWSIFEEYTCCLCGHYVVVEDATRLMVETKLCIGCLQLASSDYLERVANRIDLDALKYALQIEG